MTFHLSRRLYAAPVLLGWLGLIAVGFSPLDGVPLNTKESLVPRMLLWLAVLVAASVGARARYWIPSVADPLAANRRHWRAVLTLSVLVVALDIVANTLVLAVVLGRESVVYISVPLVAAALFSWRALAELNRVIPLAPEPNERRW
jgi:hypothetical protein